MADVSAAFSSRPWHVLNLTVVRSATDETTTTFTWRATITTSGNPNVGPFGTGNFNMTTTPGGTTHTGGTNNQSINFSYDYRSAAARNRTITLTSSGVRTAPRNGTNYNWTLVANMGLAGQAIASLDLAAHDAPVVAPSAPTYLAASTDSSDGINLFWGGASGSITNYGIWWNSSPGGAPSSGSTPDFTTSSTSYTDTIVLQGVERWYWVRAQGPGGNSAWYPAGNGIYGFRTLPQSRYYFDGQSADYISYSDSGLNNNGSTIYLPSATRTGYTFGGWWTGTNSSGTYIGPMDGAFSVGSYSSGTTFYAYWYATTYTLNYDANGGSVSPLSKTVTYNSTYGTLPTPTRSGYSFNGWFTATTGGTQVTSATIYTTASNSTIFAQWTASLPVFSDQSITTTGVLNKNINTNIDYTVSAAPVTSFEIIYSGTGLDPTSWLTISKESGTNNGILAGKPTQVGTYTFIVRAKNLGSGDTDSSLITLFISPAGKRFVSSEATQLSVAKRFDGAAWISLKVMRRFDGTAWQDIGNI